ncbi:MAG: DinB family protein [Dehalococcoidia bacterium]
MNVVPFLQQSFVELHQAYIEAISGLDSAKVHWHPGNKANQMAFVLWHYLRTQDNVIRFVLQRKPTIWMEGGWDKKFNLDSKAQGTGMLPEEAAGLRLEPWEEFPKYMKLVFKETEDYVASVREDELTREVLIKPLGQLPLIRILGTTLLTHGYSHLGELWALKGLQGMKGSPI